MPIISFVIAGKAIGAVAILTALVFFVFRWMFRDARKTQVPIGCPYGRATPLAEVSEGRFVVKALGCSDCPTEEFRCIFLQRPSDPNDVIHVAVPLADWRMRTREPRCVVVTKDILEGKKPNPIIVEG